MNTECDDLFKLILFCHAFGGCDTSGLYSIKKGSVLKRVGNLAFLQEKADVFTKPRSSCEDIIEAGEKVMMFLYSNGKKRLWP